MKVTIYKTHDAQNGTQVLASPNESNSDPYSHIAHQLSENVEWFALLGEVSARTRGKGFVVSAEQIKKLELKWKRDGGRKEITRAHPCFDLGATEWETYEAMYAAADLHASSLNTIDKDPVMWNTTHVQLTPAQLQAVSTSLNGGVSGTATMATTLLGRHFKQNNTLCRNDVPFDLVFLFSWMPNKSIRCVVIGKSELQR